MSYAEATAHKLYETYNLGELSGDVKRLLMILFLTDMNDQPKNHTIVSYEESPSATQKDELLRRARKAVAEINAGEGRDIEEFFAEKKQKYPWLCE